MKDFIKIVNWKKFWKFVLLCPVFFLGTGLLFGQPNPAWWWAIPAITALFAFGLFVNAYSEWLINQKRTSNSGPHE